MPNYTWTGVTDASGRTFDFSMRSFFCDAEYSRYRSLVVFVGAGWCGSCPSEIQRIDRMSSALDAENALILYIEGQDASYNPATGASAARFINCTSSSVAHAAGAATPPPTTNPSPAPGRRPSRSKDGKAHARPTSSC